MRKFVNRFGEILYFLAGDFGGRYAKRGRSGTGGGRGARDLAPTSAMGTSKPNELVPLQ